MIQAGLHSLTEWLKRADSACFAAKDGGRNRIHLFSEDDHELAARQGEMEWVARLTNALDDGYFSLYFQPIIPINDAPQPGAHVELLLRLEEPGGEPTPPGAFLPAAERYGLVPRLDRWVVNATFNWLCDLRRREVELPYCSVNLSGTSLSDEHFLHEIIAKLNSTGLPAELLCFEITETAAIANLARATVFIKTLKSRGCRFALDDFGSGLSSFGYLKQLPVDYLKIDGMFVRDIVDDPIDQAMVRSINEIGHVLGKQTIAEFVENDQVNQLLVEIGIDFVQGYGVAVPLPLSAFAEREMLVSD
jgi:EAL domain-containing protein (putative c-di-GMP-specific phosphodiesterase class I)